MKKKWLSSLLIILVLAGMTTGIVSAQNYAFGVDQEYADVYFNEDGTWAIEYIYNFVNYTGSSPIDYVDVGMPNDNFSLSDVTADIDGRPITDIQYADSENLAGGGSGITLALGSDAIPSGQTGKVHLKVNRIDKVFYEGTDKDHPDYASAQFKPNWFNSDYADGVTYMSVTFHMPPGVQPEEPVYYPASSSWPGTSEPATGYDDQGRITYSWTSSSATPYGEYVFGAGFPAKYIPAGAIQKKPLIDPGLLICGLVGGLILVIVVGSIWLGITGERKRKMQYLPPKISIEGHGIKRGLTAVEAAILMQEPMDKIMTMVLFGVVKKNAATVLKRDPLELEVASPMPEGLHAYEIDFLKAFQETKPAERRKALQTMMVGLVKTVSEKIKGFSRKETLDYYKTIMEQAWAQVEAADTPEVKSQRYDDVMEWTMLDHRYGERTQDVFRTGPVFMPTWYPRYNPVYRSAGGAAPISTSSSSGGKGVSLPHLPGSDFAASVVNGAQAFSAGVIGDLTSFTSGVTNQTNPVPKTTYTSSRGGGGGGHSCACACACAGCACACAGGGR